jgi:nucleotide-binding universal stress UspA family protein
MGTIFVAYGKPDGRNTVLEFAVEQAAASEHDLFVYHVQESEGGPPDRIREEVETVIQRTAPAVTFEVATDSREEVSDRTNVSKRKRLTDAILESDRDYEYVVMGAIERDSLEGVVHTSMTEAVLKLHAVPVTLVPT